jgi:hypothetical protein
VPVVVHQNLLAPLVINYYIQEVAENPVIATDFVLWIPLFFSSASVLQLGTLSLIEVSLL